jgi:hypothetical protein
MIAWMQSAVPDSVMRRIAKADYGFKESLVYAELSRILDPGELPDSTDFGVRECCNLESWRDIGDASSREDLLVLLTATFVGLSSALWWERDPRVDTIVRFVSSASECGIECALAAACSLCWIADDIPYARDYSRFLLLGVMMLECSHGALWNEARTDADTQSASLQAMAAAAWREAEQPDVHGQKVWWCDPHKKWWCDPTGESDSFLWSGTIDDLSARSESILPPSVARLFERGAGA